MLLFLEDVGHTMLCLHPKATKLHQVPLKFLDSFQSFGCFQVRRTHNDRVAPGSSVGRFKCFARQVVEMLQNPLAQQLSVENFPEVAESAV